MPISQTILQYIFTQTILKFDLILYPVKTNYPKQQLAYFWHKFVYLLDHTYHLL